MYVLREILTSPWFYRPFAIITVLLLIMTLRSGANVGDALAIAVINAFFWSLTISGSHRLSKRYRDRGP